MTDNFMHTPQSLPQLPDMNELVEAATERRDFYQGVVDRAQAEVDKANMFLGLTPLKGKRRSRRTSSPTTGPSEVAYMACLEKLATHSRANGETLANEVGYHVTTVYRCMARGVTRGHVTVLTGRKRRFQITDKGTEYITRPGVERGN